jgi:hypothetical protein
MSENALRLITGVRTPCFPYTRRSPLAPFALLWRLPGLTPPPPTRPTHSWWSQSRGTSCTMRPTSSISHTSALCKKTESKRTAFTSSCLTPTPPPQPPLSCRRCDGTGKLTCNKCRGYGYLKKGGDDK